MEYEITVEKSIRIAIQFTAEDENEARAKAEEIYERIMLEPSELEDGYVEYDYALTDEYGNYIDEWSR